MDRHHTVNEKQRGWDATDRVRKILYMQSEINHTLYRVVLRCVAWRRAPSGLSRTSRALENIWWYRERGTRFVLLLPLTLSVFRQRRPMTRPGLPR